VDFSYNRIEFQSQLTTLIVAHVLKGLTSQSRDLFLHPSDLGIPSTESTQQFGLQRHHLGLQLIFLSTYREHHAVLNGP
jgi:hypothetical protein